MNIYYEPVNLNQWHMFEKVSGVGHVETFLATKTMSMGDIILLHVGRQNKNYDSGIYAIGCVIKEPHIYKASQEDYCFNKLSVEVEIVKINYSVPYITHEECKDFIKQFRTVHKINEEHYSYIKKLLNV